MSATLPSQRPTARKTINRKVRYESEQATFAHLVHKMLAAMETSEMERYTLCRLCDDRVCTDCPIPAHKPTVRTGLKTDGL